MSGVAGWSSIPLCELQSRASIISAVSHTSRLSLPAPVRGEGVGRGRRGLSSRPPWHSDVELAMAVFELGAFFQRRFVVRAW